MKTTDRKQKESDRIRLTDEKQRRKRLRRIQKQQKRAALRSYPTVSITKNAIFYLFFWIFALLFTQALRSTLSSVLFVFSMLLPPLLFLYAMSCFLFVCESNTTDAETVEKESPLPYEIMLANNGFLAYPFIDADIRFPSRDGVSCDISRVSCALAPMGVYRIRGNAVFHYRGSYEIGVCDLYVYDVLKLFRIRMRFDNLRPVFVMPRRTVMDIDGSSAASEINTTEVRNLRGFDRTELTEIKEYSMGDSLRDIHWKLSSKTQDLMVKHYGMNACRSLCFLPDLGIGYEDPLKEGLYTHDINLCAADAVMETTIALLLAALRSGDSNVCTLLWYDRRADGIGDSSALAVSASVADAQTPAGGAMSYAARVLYNELDFERAYPFFATVPLHDAAYSAASLAAFMTEGESVTYYVITSRLSVSLITALEKSVRDYASVLLMGGLYVFFCDPQTKILDDETRRLHNEENERLIAQMRSVGMHVTVIDSSAPLGEVNRP